MRGNGYGSSQQARSDCLQGQGAEASRVLYKGHTKPRVIGWSCSGSSSYEEILGAVRGYDLDRTSLRAGVSLLALVTS